MSYCFPISLGLAAGLVATTLAAQPQASTPEAETTQIAPEHAEHITLTLDAAVANSYFWRGIVQETDGVISQPGAALSVDLEPLTGAPLSFFAGIWNSFHDRGTGASDTDDFVSRWYEFDLFAGVETNVDRWTVALAYTLYSSPNGAFGSVDEISATGGFDDSDLIPVALAPSATLAFEFGENEADGGTGQGIFLGLGVAPSWDFEQDDLPTLTLTVPAEIGLSLKDYYEDATGDDDLFGFARIGADLSVDLPVTPGYGSWSASAGIGLLFLGDNTSSYNDGDDFVFQFAFGISAEI